MRWVRYLLPSGAMRWSVVRLTALYVASVSILVVCATNPVRTGVFLRRQMLLIAGAVRGVSETATNAPVVSVLQAVEPPASVPAKPQGSRTEEHRVAAGRILSARLRTPLNSSTNQVNDQVDAVLSEPVTQDDVELIPAGSLVHGTIVHVRAATREAPLGQISFTFAATQHAQTRSRAAIRTRTIALEAQAPIPAGDAPRTSKRQPPVDLVLAAGYPLRLTLEAPLVVHIPTASRR